MVCVCGETSKGKHFWKLCSLACFFPINESFCCEKLPIFVLFHLFVGLVFGREALKGISSFPFYTKCNAPNTFSKVQKKKDICHICHILFHIGANQWNFFGNKQMPSFYKTIYRVHGRKRPEVAKNMDVICGNYCFAGKVNFCVSFFRVFLLHSLCPWLSPSNVKHWHYEKSILLSYKPSSALSRCVWHVPMSMSWQQLLTATSAKKNQISFPF